MRWRGEFQRLDYSSKMAGIVIQSKWCAIYEVSHFLCLVAIISTKDSNALLHPEYGYEYRFEVHDGMRRPPMTVER